MGQSKVILISGQTGVEKSTVVEKLRRKILEKKGLTATASNELAQRVVRVYDIEQRIIEETGKFSLKPFLDNFSPTARKFYWENAAGSIVLEVDRLLKSDNPPEVIISFHAVFYRDHEFLDCLNPACLLKIQPDVIVTLIDDCYDIVYRVHEKREKHGMRTRTKLTIDEALSWRSAEIMVTDLLCKMCENPPSHYIVPVKHSVDMLYGLLFEEMKLRIYASYPMTNLRHDDKCNDEIRKFLNELEANFVVFNPATIDELRGSDQNTKRFPLSISMVSAKKDFFSEYFEDIQRLQAVIQDQIVARDYLFVRQAELAVAYRPFWNGKLSDGVEKEIVHTLTEGREILVFSPKEDNKKTDKKVFKTVEKAILATSIDELNRCLNSFQEKKREILETL